MTQVRTSVEGSAARITFVTADGLNVLSAVVFEQLEDALEEVAAAKVRTTIVGAEGKAFVAGADIKEMAPFDPAHARMFSLLGNRVLDALAALPSITVAALNGAAMGGGLEVALACDFRIAVKTVKLALPESRLGLVPGWGGIRRSVQLIGPSRAKRLMFGGNPISAEEALHWGLVDEVVNSVEDLMPRVLAFCKTLTGGGPAAIARIKKAILGGDEVLAFADCFADAESKEGMRAFLDKRAASWTT